MTDVAARVRRQYEEAPYPRWTSPVRPSDELRGAVPHVPCRILVAGCGTGRDAIAAALTFPDAETVAVDVSAPSLREARGHADAYGVTVGFAVADLRDLPAVPRYDLVLAVGVLHHLDDPEGGLATLRDTLADDGRMVVTFYSRAGRAPLREARDQALKHGYERTLNGATRFLAEAPDVLPPTLLARLRRYPDFRYAAGVRDLLFHEHETEFDLDEIAAMLARLNLRCIQVLTHTHTAEAFLRMFDAGRLTDLAAWRDFEMLYPGTFRAMYRLVLAHDAAW